MESVEILDPENEHDNAILTYTAETATRRKRKILLSAFIVIGILVLGGFLFSQMS